MGTLRVYVGCGNERGDIELYGLDEATGALAHGGATASGSSTSFMAMHPSGRFAYTTQNRADRLSAFAVDAGTGALRPLGGVPIAGAPGAAQAGPAHVTVDASGRFLMAANYRGHNAVVFALEEDGRIGAQLDAVSAGHHAHAAVIDPSNRFVFVPFLGSDLVAQYRLEPTGRLAPNDSPALRLPDGTGPRHLAFHPDGRRAYLIGELGGTVHALSFDPARGTLTEEQRLDAHPAGYAGRRWSADIHVHPGGRLLYASNRAHESLAIFAIGADGALTPRGHQDVGGRTPRSFAITPDGRLLLAANQDSAHVQVFAIDPATGALARRHTQPTGPNPYFVRLGGQRSM